MIDLKRISGKPDILFVTRMSGRPDILFLSRISGRPDIRAQINASHFAIKGNGEGPQEHLSGIPAVEAVFRNAALRAVVPRVFSDAGVALHA